MRKLIDKNNIINALVNSWFFYRKLVKNLSVFFYSFLYRICKFGLCIGESVC